ncbi:MAG: ribosomal biogenesis protein [Methanomassiliicoccaceae archaeon]|jgi:nucleolar protein 56|nr:ribosomal biogenesis protein [Methanomassiliicoccaceae archaeon]
MILVTKWFGVFLCDESKIIDKRLMPKDAKKIAEKLAEMQRGSLLPEETELAKDRKKLRVSERRQSELGKPMMFDSSFIKADQYGFSNELMHAAMLSLGKLRTSEPIPRDKSLVQAIRHLDDLIVSCNLLNERLHEWYGLHFPELGDHAKDRRYCELIVRHGERGGIIKELGLTLESIGSEMNDVDIRTISALAETLCGIYDDRGRTEAYISELSNEVAPNMCALMGSSLAARLISSAGGLDRLASLPSSTLQLLGAEKAMFRHLKSGKKPPKHGIIFQHPEIHRAPYWQRGNISRALAGKALIAAKVDRYNGEFIGGTLLTEFNEKVEGIKKRYPEPPKRSEPKKKQKAKRRT